MKTSAGILMYRTTPTGLEVLLAHPGGPFFSRRREGVWSIPKGLAEPGEELLAAARREFEEETGLSPCGELTSLGSVKQKGGKVVHAWGLAGDCDATRLESDTFTMEWPPRSGRMAEFPEVDEFRWCDVDEARRLLTSAQIAFLDRLLESDER